MSAYKNFIQDFPARCEKLLDRIERGNKFDDKKVTGLLLVASSAVCIPYDRLRPVSNETMPHPSGDTEKYSIAARQFQQLWNSNIVGSRLCPKEERQNWLFTKLDDVQGDPDGWQTDFKEISKDKKVSSFLKIMRNALAHGNIYTKGSQSIAQILFVSSEPDRKKCLTCGTTRSATIKHYNCLAVTPDAFEQFLKHWFEFIKELEIPPVIYNDIEGENKYAAMPNRSSLSLEIR